MQFHLSTIFLAAVVLAMSLAMGHVVWLVMAVAAIALVSQSEHVVACFVVLGISLAIFFVILLPGFRAAREAETGRECPNNLKQFALALQNYHDAYGTFLPAAIVGEDGTPMHSWRTLILPYIEQERLYRRYQFDEPWNSPNNSALIQERPSYGLVCPRDTGAGKEMTSYVAVVGPKSLWGKSLPKSSKDYEKVVMACDWPSSGIAWTEPRDLRREDVGRWLQMVVRPDDGHPGGVVVAYADGSTGFLAWYDPAELVRVLFDDELTDDERRLFEEYAAEREWQIRLRTAISIATPIAWLTSIIIMVLHLRAIRRKRPALP